MAINYTLLELLFFFFWSFKMLEGIQKLVGVFFFGYFAQFLKINQNQGLRMRSTLCSSTMDVIHSKPDFQYFHLEHSNLISVKKKNKTNLLSKNLSERQKAVTK